MIQDDMTEYIYRPITSGADFRDCFEALTRRNRRVIPTAIDNIAGQTVGTILRQAREAKMTIEELHIERVEYDQYIADAGYDRWYPEYYSFNRFEKRLEHFVALRLLEVSSRDIFIDVAAENSPVYEIYQRLTGARTFCEDIMYPKGVNGRRIGGDATAMPIGQGFASKAALTCSLEHFEEDSDIRLFHELHRILVPGGKVCVVPFYLYVEDAIQTDPTVSGPLELSFDPTLPIYCAEGWGNRFGRFYSPAGFMSRIFSPLRAMFEFKFYHFPDVSSIDQSIYLRFAFTATRI